MSSLFLTSFTQNPSSLLVLHCHRMTNAFEFMFSSIICPPGCFSLYRIKAPKGVIEFLSSRISNFVDVPRKKNLLDEDISLLSCWRHSPSIRMHSVLKPFAKPLPPIPSAFFPFSDVVGLLQLFTASQNLCWLEIYMVIFALVTRQRD